MATDINPVAGEPAAGTGRIVINLPPSVLVTAPNGGEMFQPGQPVLIRWDSFDADGSVLRHDVRFSADGGLTFSNIVTGLFGEVQSYNWIVPATSTSQGRIEVIAYDELGRSGRDRSNANFAIGGSVASTITSLQPATLRAGETTQLSVAGTGLALDASAYQVVTAAGFGVPGVLVLGASGSSTGVSLLVDVAAGTAAGNYQLRMQSPGGPVMAPLAVSAVAVSPALAVTPVSQSVNAGGNVSYQVNISPPVTSGSVSLAVSGLPAGASAAFTPNPTGSNAATLNIAASSDTLPGTRQLTVTASAPGVQIAPASIGLTVQAGVVPSCMLAVDPAVVTVVRGQSASSGITLVRSNFSAPVQLTLSGLPAGVSAAFSPNPVAGNSATLTLQAATDAAVGNSTLRVDGSATGISIAGANLALTVAPGTAQPVPGIPIPAGQALLATRFATRRNPANGQLQQQAGVLTQGSNANGVRFSLLRTFVEGSDAPVLQIQRMGSNRYTDFRFVDFAGDGNAYLACVSEKSQDDDTADLVAQIQIREPQQGTVVQGVTLASTVRPFGSTQVSTINPDFGGMATLRIGSQEYLAVIPQNSFATIGQVVTSTMLYFFRFANGSVQRADFTLGEQPGGATVQRAMLAAGMLGGTGAKSFLVFSKNLLLVMDPVSGQRIAQRTVDVDLNNPDATDVPNPPGNTMQSTPGGRRYGQFRLADIRGGAGQEILVASHSLPKPNNSFPEGLHGMYTTLPTIQPGSTGFIQPIWGPAGAPGNSERRYRFFRDATKKPDDRSPELKRLTFANGALLLGGTPPSGIDDLGDGTVSMVVSDAPPTAVPASSPSIQLLDATTGINKLNAAFAGAVALDVLRTPNGPARIIAWGGLAAQQPYAAGRLQVLRYDQFARALLPMTRANGAPGEFEQGRQPVLLSFRTLDRLPEDLGVSSDRLALFMATPQIGLARTFLASRNGEPGMLEAYDIDTLELVPAGRRLELGQGSQLLAIVDGLPLAAAEAILPGSAFVVQETAADGSQVIRFKRVAPDGRLVAARL